MGNQFSENDVNRNRASGRFDEKPQSAPEAGLPTAGDLTTATPVTIDSELAELYDVAWTAREKAWARQEEADRYRKYAEQNRRFPARVAEYGEVIERCEAQARRFEAEADEAARKAKPLNDEYERRGGWGRAFLAASSNGHVHSSMSCSTCNKRGIATRFAWMTDYSGATETDIVEAAGERACTTCYPSAPVDVLSRPTKMFSKDEIAAAEARAARDAERAEKAKVREAKAIANPDGSPIRRGYRSVATLVSAERELVDALVYEVVNENNPGHFRFDTMTDTAEWADTLVAAIARKKGISAEQVRAEARAKAEKKYKRDWR